MPIDGDEKSGWKPGKPALFVGTRNDEQDAVFSPDGRWIAYESRASGRAEVVVRPFPGPGGQWQISTAGGSGAMWSQTPGQLFYLASDNRIMVVSYKVEGESFKAEKPPVWSQQAVLRRPRRRSVDLDPEGERFAVAVETTPSENKPERFVFVFNFLDELRRLAPKF